jgi:hypothetical protein
MHIYTTGGLGDVVTLESHFEEPPARISWASRARPDLEPLFRIAYPDTEHVDLWSGLEDQRTPYRNGTVPRTTCPDDAEDWSIEVSFLMCRLEHPFRGSRLLKVKLADLEHVELPPSFVVVQHDTPFNPADSRRTLEPLEWAWMLENTDLPLVVVGCEGSARLPQHPRILDRTGLPLGQSIEILKRAEAYWGIDSVLSVLAAQRLPADKLRVRGTPGWLDVSKDLYYRPHTNFDFIKRRLYEDEPLYKSMPGYVKVITLRECFLNKTIPQGMVIELHPEVARDWIKYGLAEDWTAKEMAKQEFKKELEESFVEAVKEKRKAKKPKVEVS